MKHLIILIIPALLLVTTLGWAQSTFTIKPSISTTALTCGATIGVDTLTSSAAFGSVAIGQRVVGDDIPFGTKVNKVISTSAIIISNPSDSTHASVSLRFGYFTTAAYAVGDALGFPFALPTMRLLKQVVIVDDAKAMTVYDLVFFNATFVETADTTAFAISDADAEKLVGFVTVGGTGGNKVFGDNQVINFPPTTLGLHFSNSSKMYCQLVAAATGTFTAVDNLTVTFIYE